VTCNYCKKKGHIKKNCLKLKEKEKKPSDAASVAEDDGSDHTALLVCMLLQCRLFT